MRTSSVAVRGLALAVLGLGAGPALGQNVTAFDPYSGVGLQSGPAIMSAPRATPMAGPMGTSGPSPATGGGLAFNPWNPTGVAEGWAAAYSSPQVQVPQAQPPQSRGVAAKASVVLDRGAGLPPPPGPIESRLIAIPERPGASDTMRRGRAATAAPVPLARNEAPPPAPAEVTPPLQSAISPPPAAVAPPAAAAPAPQVVSVPATPPPAVSPKAQRPPAATPPSPPPPVAAAPAPAAAPPPSPTPAPATSPAVASAAPITMPPPPPATAATANVQFAGNSAEISDVAKAELNRVAADAIMHSYRQIELRAFAGGTDLAESRKISLARALAVRSYLIDQGVKSRIEVGAFGAAAGGGPVDRVDLLTPAQ